MRSAARLTCMSTALPSLFALTPKKATEIVRRYGADRVLFGTDYPMWNPRGELERL